MSLAFFSCLLFKICLQPPVFFRSSFIFYVSPTSLFHLHVGLNRALSSCGVVSKLLHCKNTEDMYLIKIISVPYMYKEEPEGYIACNAVEQSPSWEHDSHSATQIPCILFIKWNFRFIVHHPPPKLSAISVRLAATFP